MSQKVLSLKVQVKEVETYLQQLENLPKKAEENWGKKKIGSTSTANYQIKKLVGPVLVIDCLLLIFSLVIISPFICSERGP